MERGARVGAAGDRIEAPRGGVPKGMLTMRVMYYDDPPVAFTLDESGSVQTLALRNEGGAQLRVVGHEGITFAPHIATDTLHSLGEPTQITALNEGTNSYDYSYADGQLILTVDVDKSGSSGGARLVTVREVQIVAGAPMPTQPASGSHRRK